MVEKGKMGTLYARDMIQDFREITADNKFPELSAKLTALADKLEIVCGKIWYKTQKGNEYMEKMAIDMDGFKGKVAACADAAAAEAFAAPFIKSLDDTANMVMEMKVRMT
jgi:hypothetical protein